MLISKKLNKIFNKNKGKKRKIIISVALSFLRSPNLTSLVRSKASEFNDPESLRMNSGEILQTGRGASKTCSSLKSF
jgi:hypothetical protein